MKKPEDWRNTRVATATATSAHFMAMLDDAPADAYIVVVVAEPIPETTPGTLRVHWRIASNVVEEVVPAILGDAVIFLSDRELKERRS